jgi:hypothetical protein
VPSRLSLDIIERFNKWYGQRRHTIDHQADGAYFRISVADDRRPGVRIELEGAAKASSGSSRSILCPWPRRPAAYRAQRSGTP